MSAKKIIILPNGTVAVFNENGQQIPEIQGGWINFDYLRKLAQIIVKDNPIVEGELVLSGYPLVDMVMHYRKYMPIKCAFCQHGKGYHYDESIRGVTQLPCNFTWEEDGRPVSCLCYGWCETKEQAEELAREVSCPTCLHPKSSHDNDGCNENHALVKCNCPGLWVK